MPDQLSFFDSTKQPPTDLPPAVARILNAARSVGAGFSARVVRGHWGIGVGPKRKWVLMGDCCCALAALLVAEGAQHESGDASATPAVARTLGVTEHEVYQFVDGFDGDRPDDGSTWYGYGRRVAEELGIR